MIVKSVTRREFFSHVYTKDFWSGIVGLYYGFNEELNKAELKRADKLSCEEVAIMFGKNAKRKISKLYENNNDGKEG